MTATLVNERMVTQKSSKEALDFAPGLLAIQEAPPSRMPRAVLYSVTLLLVLALTWATFGHLDIVASAEGHLVPRTYVKLVQPADAGIVKEILVREGERVTAGQVLLRMDAQDAQADTAKLRSDLALRSLQLRRIDAELTGTPLSHQTDDPPDLYRQVQAQYRERRQAYLDALAQAQEQLHKAQRDHESGQAVLAKLHETNPILKEQAQAYAGLGGEGYVPKVTVNEKQRAYIENEQDLKAQEATVRGLLAAVNAADQQVRQSISKYHSDLQNERMEAEGNYRKLQQDLAKQTHRSNLLELKAPQSGIVKDLATHTIGTVVSTGTVLLTLVPEHEPLVAEVMVRNDDVGFIHPNQKVKLKLAAYPFQKYGLLDGEVQQVWPDASESEGPGTSAARPGERPAQSGPSTTGGFKALVSLDRQSLTAGGESLALVAGMQVIAEVREGRRTVMEYLLSPLQGTLHDGGRER
jgi:membrane fusion protein, hemolysin D